jgi:prevent-host-death family protein
MATVHHPNTIGAYDAKTRFSELLDQVQSGEEITITKHGTPVARLVPVKKKTTPQERREAIERWKESSKGITLGGLKIRDLINEGRP